MKFFEPLNVSSKFAICGLPIRVDTYKTCSFGCKYCFSNNRKIMEFKKEIQLGNVESVHRRLERIKQKGANPKSFLDVLIENEYTWHAGGMSDPFQPCEEEYKITKKLLDVTNKYGVNILFSTKSDTVYQADIRPELHSFQLSVTNTLEENFLEPEIPSFENRYKFYKDLKNNGFKVGIRIQPFIPGITKIDILDAFHDADHFTIEGIKLVPQNKEHKEELLAITGLSKEDFTQMGLLNLKPEIRTQLYKPFIEILEKRKSSYSIADNDMHHIGNSYCCCGDDLVHKSTEWNTTAMCQYYGKEYAKELIDEILFETGVRDCKCNQLFTSNRQEGCESVQDFYDKRFYRKSSPFSPQYLID